MKIFQICQLFFFFLNDQSLNAEKKAMSDFENPRKAHALMVAELWPEMQVVFPGRGSEH